MNQKSRDLWIHLQNSTSLHYLYVHGFYSPETTETSPDIWWQWA